MSRVSTEKKTCPVCGSEFITEEWVSLYKRDNTLDGKPDHGMYHLCLQQCPNCFYTAEEMKPPVSAAVKQMVQSAEFQKQASLQYDPQIKKFVCGAAVAKAAGKTYLSAKCYLMAAWRYEELNHPQEALQSRERYLRTVLEDKSLQLSPGQMLTYVDTLRQAHKYEMALTMIARYFTALEQSFGADSNLIKLLGAEKTFAEQCDAAPHSLSEVL